MTDQYCFQHLGVIIRWKRGNQSLAKSLTVKATQSHLQSVPKSASVDCNSMEVTGSQRCDMLGRHALQKWESPEADAGCPQLTALELGHH